MGDHGLSDGTASGEKSAESAGRPLTYHRHESHLLLSVRDLPSSVGFYRDVLGWRLWHPKPEEMSRTTASVILLAPHGQDHRELVLVARDRQAAKGPGPVPELGGPLCLRVGSGEADLRVVRERLSAAGVPVIGNRTLPGWQGVYLLDPDGRQVELFVSPSAAAGEQAGLAEVPRVRVPRPSAAGGPTIVFLLGIERRCGTHYLFELLGRHPDIQFRPPIWEDFILDRIGPVIDFATGADALWRAYYELDRSDGSRLLTLLGEAVEKYLVDQHDSRYVVLKTPTTRNLRLAPVMFPESPLILLVRDGRSVCESASRTFGDERASVARAWAANGREILDFLDEPAGPGPARLLVRYEDLVQHTEAELTRIFTALGLSAADYDFGRALRQPVRGSSDYRGSSPTVHWEQVSKGPDFDPLARHSHWSKAQLDEFDEIAIDVLERFGYSRST